MSSSKNISKATTEDLSSTKELAGFPSFNASMLGGNTVTNKDPNFSGQGSDSEATHDIAARDLDYAGYGHNTPDLPGAKTPASDLDVDEKGSGYAPSARSWKEL